MQPGIVFIPALGCDAGLYAPIMDGISDLAKSQIIIPKQDSLPACVDQVLNEAPEKFIVIGTSFGGHVARKLALAAPKSVYGLMIMGAGAGKAADPQAGRHRSYRLRHGEHAEVIGEMAAIITSPASPHFRAARDQFLAMGLSSDPEIIALQNDALIDRPDRWNELEKIPQPALLLWGKDDRFSPASDGLRMSALMPHARFVELEDVGHLPSLEAPDETIAALRHWLMDILP